MESISIYDQLVSSDWLEQDAFSKAFPEDALFNLGDEVTNGQIKPVEGDMFTDLPIDSLDSGLDLFGENWPDQKVDLFDYLGCGDLDVGLSSLPEPEQPPKAEEDVSPALQILQNLAKETEMDSESIDFPTVNFETVDISNLLSISLESSVSPDLTSPDTSLSYVSAEDVESILSSGPSSPGESVSSLDSEWTPKERSTPYSRSPKSKTVKPKTKALTDRKQRKKEQNKTAALRYRVKKRQEQDQVSDESSKLEERNRELRDKVDQMTREIKYLKDLMQEVYKVKGLITSKI